MSFQETYKQYELKKLLDYYNLEVMSFNLQNEAIKTGLIITPNSETIYEYFNNQLKVELYPFDFTKGFYRLLKYVPDFKNHANKLLFFEDDDFIFTNLQTQKQYIFSGKQILVSDIKKQPLIELLKEGTFILTISEGSGRYQMREYLNYSDYEKEFSLKIGLHENIRQCFLKHKDNLSKIDQILTKRFNLLKLTKPNFDWKSISAISAIKRSDWFIQHYQIPNFKIQGTTDCLKIKEIFNSFYKNTDNSVFLKEINRPLSYSYHIEKFLKRLRYQVNKTNRITNKL